jgi:HipA-like protein
MTKPAALSIFFGDELVGTVYDASPLIFEYATSWLQRPQPWALSTISLQTGKYSSAAIEAFFENLLPEGDLRTYVAEQRQASTLFSLLREIAGDTAGGFVLLPDGQVPQPARYKPTSWGALATMIQARSAAAIGRLTMMSAYRWRARRTKPVLRFSPMVFRICRTVAHPRRIFSNRIFAAWPKSANRQPMKPC